MKPYNPIKAEEKIMNEPLTKDEQKFIDGFRLNQELVTEEEVISELHDIDQIIKIDYPNDYKIFTNTLRRYLKQQKQKELKSQKEHELLVLKNKMINAYQAYLASVDTHDRVYVDKWKNEIFRLQDDIYTKEKEIEEMK